MAKLLLQHYLSLLILKCFHKSKIHCVIACFVFRRSEILLVVGGLETLLVLDACKLEFNVYTSDILFLAENYDTDERN